MEEAENKGRKGGISRRDFIKGTGLAVGGVAISSTVLGVACKSTPATENTTPGVQPPVQPPVQPSVKR